MNYELHYFSKNDPQIKFTKLRKFLSEQSGELQVTEKNWGFLLAYSNEYTGVYCLFTFTTEMDPDQLIGERKPIPASLEYSGVSFYLNYRRPTFFARESISVALSIANEFDKLMYDPRLEKKPQSFSESELIESWKTGNRDAVKIAIERGMDGKYYMPEDKLKNWWRYHQHIPVWQNSYSGQVNVPGGFIIRQEKTQDLMTAVAWPDGDPTIIPPFDKVVLFEEPRNEYSSSTEDQPPRFLVDYETVIEKINSYLEEPDGSPEGVKLLPPSEQEHVEELYWTFSGSPLENFERVPIDSIYDVNVEHQL